MFFYRCISSNIMRQEALNWWNGLDRTKQVEYWLEYKQSYFSPSFNSSELTGREIEIIYKNNLKE